MNPMPPFVCLPVPVRLSRYCFGLPFNPTLHSYHFPSPILFSSLSLFPPPARSLLSSLAQACFFPLPSDYCFSFLEHVRGFTGFCASLIRPALSRYSPVHHAAFYGHAELVERLVDFGADVNARDLYEWTPLHYAALKGRTDTCVALLHCGADVMALTRTRKTPLQKAVYTYQACRACLGGSHEVPVYILPCCSRGGSRFCPVYEFISAHLLDS